MVMNVIITDVGWSASYLIETDTPNLEPEVWPSVNRDDAIPSQDGTQLHSYLAEPSKYREITGSLDGHFVRLCVQRLI